MVLSDDEESPLFARTAKDPLVQLIRTQWHEAKAMRNLNDRRGIYLLAPLRIDDR